jgi:hypothetical protein
MTSKLLTEQITFAGLRSSAERLGIPSFARMRKQELIKAINEAQKLCTCIAEYNSILISLDTLTIGKQQQWLENQPEPKNQS